MTEPPGAGSSTNGTRLSGQAQQKLVEWVRRCYSSGKASRIANERQWYLNMAFYAGKQNVEFFRQSTSPLGVRLRVPEAPPWRVRLVINRIRPILRKEQAKLTSSKPQFVAVPATSDDHDLAAARAGEKLLEALWADLKLDQVTRQVVWWTTICGTAFYKDWWDPAYGEPDPATGKPEGAIRVEAVNPFHLVVPDLREQGVDAQPWVIHATTHPAEWVRHTLGKDISSKATVASTEAIMEDVLSGQFQPRPTQQVLCLETWVRPGVHRDLPEGGLVTVVGDQLIQAVDYAVDPPVYDHCETPFSKVGHIPMGRFYDESSVTDLVPLQRELNRTRSQIVENKNLMGRGKWMAPKGCVDPTAINTDPGQVITYELGYGAKPEMIPAPPIPSYVIQQVEQLQVDFDDVSGQHQISRGFAPSHTAAAAIAYLQEQDDTLLANTTANLEEAVARVGRHALSHVRQYWPGPRLIRMVGPDGSFDAMMFAASDVRGVADIRVQAGSSLPVSKAARTATLMDLYGKGVFGPPGGPASAPGAPEAGTKLLTALDLGGVDKAMEDWQVDRRQVDRENILMSRGLAVMPNAYDNNDAHIAGHQRFQKGQEFQALPPQVQQIFAQHVAEHQATAMAATVLNAQAGGAGPGLTGIPGGGPGGLPSVPGGAQAPPAPGPPALSPQPPGQSPGR